MKALVFAAGLGTRLRPLTDNMPKALVPIAGKTLLEWQIRKLKDAGINDIIVNVHHFPDMIIDFLHAHNNFGCNIMVSDERDMLLDTGGGLLKALRTFANEADEPVMALNVDILSTIRIEDVMAAYNPQSLGLLVVSERKTQRYLCFDDDNRLVGWTNVATGEIKPANSTSIRHKSSIHLLAFSGMQVLSADVLPLLENFAVERGAKFSVIDFYLWLVEKQAAPLYACTMNVPLMDVGKINHLSEAEDFARTL